MKLELTEREAKDIQLALYYRYFTGAHGASGHNWMTLVAKMAGLLGLDLEMYAEGITLADSSPLDEVVVVDVDGNLVTDLTRGTYYSP